MKRLLPYLLVAVLIFFTLLHVRTTRMYDYKIANLTKEIDNKNAEITHFQQILKEATKTNKQFAQKLATVQQSQRFQEIIAITSPMQEYFNLVRTNHGQREWWKESGQYERQAMFAAAIARNAAGELVWKREEGKFSRATDQNSYVLQADKLDALIRYKNITGTHTEKLRAVLDVLQTVRYEEDLNDAFRFPLETLNLASGDCDDFTILAAALLKRVGVPSAIVLVSSADGKQAHAWLAVKGEYGLPNYAINVTGTWQVVEPQFTLEEQKESWFKKFPRILAVAEV